jgi:signal peptidase I
LQIRNFKFEFREKGMTEKEKKTEQTEVKAEEKIPLKKKIIREIVSWAWVIAAFLFIQSTLVQARVIPSGSMEKTLLIGDHLLVSRFGYDAEIPFTGIHWSLWRDLERQQVVVFRPPMPGAHDYIKRIIGVPGDRLEIKQGVVWINGKPLDEPYLLSPPDAQRYNFPLASDALFSGATRDWAEEMPRHIRDGRLVVPPGKYFVMGDNRGNSYDSRFWGFVPRENFIGTPLIIYMSVDASEEAWQPGHIGQRFAAYGRAIFSPSMIRWKRLFITF